MATLPTSTRTAGDGPVAGTGPSTDRPAVAVRRAAEARQLLRRLEPPLGRPQRVTELRFSGAGLVTGLFFLTTSLLPSLLPRDAVVQGVISGVSLLVGYGIGTGAASLYRFLRFPEVPQRVRAVLLALTVGVVLVLAVLAVWKQVGWQNDIRRLYGMEPIGPGGWPLILAVTLLVAAGGLVLTRLGRAAFRRVRHLLGRHLSRELSGLLGGGARARRRVGDVHRGARQRLLRRRQRPVRPARQGHQPRPAAAHLAGALGWPRVTRRLGGPRARGPQLRLRGADRRGHRRGHRGRGEAARCGSTWACATPTPSRSGPGSSSRSSSAPAGSTARSSSSRRPPAPATWTATAPTRSSSCGTVTPPSPACSTPTFRAGSRCSPTRRRRPRPRGPSSTPSRRTGRPCPLTTAHGSTSTGCRSAPTAWRASSARST